MGGRGQWDGQDVQEEVRALRQADAGTGRTMPSEPIVTGGDIPTRTILLCLLQRAVGGGARRHRPSSAGQVPQRSAPER